MTKFEFEAKYPVILGWIRQAISNHAGNRKPVSSLNFQRLPHYFSPKLLAYAKVIYTYFVPVPPLTQLGLSQFTDFEKLKPDGITFLDTFFIVQEKQNAESLHFHELVHIIQWKLLGPKAFVAAYANGLERFGYRNSPLEVMAYDAEAEFKKSSQPFDVEKLVQSRLK